MARRGAGEGTIVKRKKCPACKKYTTSANEKNLKKCKSCEAELPGAGQWMGAVVLGFDVEKKSSKRKYFYGKTRAEVAEKLAEAQARAKNGISEPSKKLLAEWLDEWLNDYMKPSLRPTTWESYKTQAEKHIKPELGHLQLKQLQTAHLQKLYNEKLEDGRADGKKKCEGCGKTSSKKNAKVCKSCGEGLKPVGLSPRSVRYIHNTIHGALEQAKKERLVQFNVADNVKLPKQEQKEIKYLDQEGVAKFLAAAAGTIHFPAYYLVLATGLRRGELLALRWKDVDLKNGTISVTQNLVRTKGGLKFQQPKTKLAARTVNIPADVVEVLKFHKKRWEAQKEKAGEVWQDKITFLGAEPGKNDLVFPNEIGQPRCPRTFTRGFERLLQKAGLEGITFHALRHSYATLSLQEGVDFKTIQENLGHYDPAFTLRVYSGVTDRMKKHATDKIGNLLTSCFENK